MQPLLHELTCLQKDIQINGNHRLFLFVLSVIHFYPAAPIIWLVIQRVALVPASQYSVQEFSLLPWLKLHQKPVLVLFPNLLIKEDGPPSSLEQQTFLHWIFLPSLSYLLSLPV